LREQGLEDKVQVNLTDKGLHVTITDSVMFASGSAMLFGASKTLLRRIRAYWAMMSRAWWSKDIRTTAPSERFSSPRTGSFRRREPRRGEVFLEEENELSPARYLAVGYGEFHPVDTNDTRPGRSRNRRVEILFSWEPWQNDRTPYLPRQMTALQ
jgi:chemotaxis protein MotB